MTTSENVKPIAGALRAARVARRMTQSQLARRLGRATSRVSEVETGEADPRVSTVVQMGRALGLELMFVPERQVSAVRDLLSAGPGMAQPASTVPSVHQELFVPDPDPEPSDSDDEPSR